MVSEIEADMAIQLERLHELQQDGELAPLPAL
jgi:hypothetical protein